MTLNLESLTTGMILIMIGTFGLFVIVLSFFVFIRRSVKKKFENFNAGFSHKLNQSPGNFQILSGEIKFSDEKQWHKGRGTPQGIRGVNISTEHSESDLYANRSSENMEVTEKLKV